MGRRSMTRILCALAVVGLIAGGLTGCEDTEKDQPTTKTTKADQQPGEEAGTKEKDLDSDGEGQILEVGQADFDEKVLRAPLPVLVDFYADWCGPCHVIHPTLEEIAQDYAGRVRVVQVDVDQNPDLAQQYNVRSIPALFVIKNGEVADSTIGVQRKHELESMLDRVL